MAGIVNVAQGGADRAGMHTDRARLFFAVEKVTGQGLDVAVKNQPYQFQVAVYDRTARVSTNDIGCANEVQWNAVHHLVLF